MNIDLKNASEERVKLIILIIIFPLLVLYVISLYCVSVYYRNTVWIVRSSWDIQIDMYGQYLYIYGHDNKGLVTNYGKGGGGAKSFHSLKGGGVKSVTVLRVARKKFRSRNFPIL